MDPLDVSIVELKRIVRYINAKVLNNMFKMVYAIQYSFEPRHDKTNIMGLRPA
jgi:hypothetical protein